MTLVADPQSIFSELVVIVRDEVRSILEWVAYHRVIGFKSIVIYDNDSRDGTRDLCQNLHDAGLIVYRPWPDDPSRFPTGPQVPAYEHAASCTRADWICCLDIDEFLVLDAYPNVDALIRVAGRTNRPIALNWKIFGSNGEHTYRDELVTRRFTRCGRRDDDVNRHIKTLGPVSLLKSAANIHVHGWVLHDSRNHYVDAAGNPVVVDGCTFVTPPRWNGAWINHYIVKSRQEFEEKCRRGKATHLAGGRDKFDRSYEHYFIPYDRNDDQDFAIQQHLPRLQYEMFQLAKCHSG